MLKRKQEMKQSGNNPKPNKTEPQKPKTFKDKLENFMYHYKAQLILGIFLVLVSVVFIVDIVNQVDYDGEVLIVSNNYLIEESTASIKNYFEEIYTDVNGDGEINISITSIYLNENEINTEADMAARTKLMGELSIGKNQIFIFDEENLKNNLSFDEGALFLSVDGKNTFSIDNTELRKFFYDDNKYFIAIRNREEVEFKSSEDENGYNEIKKILNTIRQN